MAAAPSRTVLTLLMNLASSSASRVRSMSARLSSTSRIWMNDGSVMIAQVRGRSRKGAAEPGATQVRVLDPDATVVQFDDLLGDGKTDARPGVRLPDVQTLEHPEDPLPILRFHPDAVVVDGQGHPATGLGAGDPDLDGPVVRAELD